MRAGGSCEERRLLQPIKTIINCGQSKLRPGSSWARQTEGKVEARESASARASARATPAPLSLSHTHTHTRRSATCDDRGYFSQSHNHHHAQGAPAAGGVRQARRFLFFVMGALLPTLHISHARARENAGQEASLADTQPASHPFFSPFSSPPLFFAVSRVRGAIAHPLPLSSPLPERLSKETAGMGGA